MQKLIILDSETGVCHIHNLDTESANIVDEDMDMYISERYNLDNVQWMIALEINDTTI